MDVTLSPYLTGIQKVAGITQSAKLNTLNRIAKKMIEAINDHESLESALEKSEMPDVMKPLVRVEIARQLKQPEEIVKALRSNDSVVVDRALRAKWFFKGDENSIELFREIWPFVSLQSRAKIIKMLANNLTEIVGEEFYSELSLLYGEKQAHPLLIACREPFIWRCLTEQKIRLSNRLIRFLFYKYPELVINYVKFGVQNPDDRLSLNIEFVSYFLPRLIKKRPADFVEIMELYGYNLIHLSNIRTALFLKNCMDTLMTNAELFFPMLDLKTVTRKLTDEQFKTVFKQVIPKKVEDVRVSDLWRYFKFVEGEKRLPLLLSSFEEVYKVSLFDCPDKIYPHFMRLLPREARNSQARIKLEQPESKRSRGLEYEWICYLPTKESVLSIMTEISKTSNGQERCFCLKKLVYTCLVNSDSNQLLQMLKYISTRHKNERSFYLLDVLDVLIHDINVKIMTRNHLVVFYGILKSLHVKNELPDNFITKGILTAAVCFDYKKNSTTEHMSFFVDLVIKGFNYFVNVFENNLLLKRKFLEEMFAVLPSKFSEKEKPNLILVKTIAAAMQDFNDRNLKANCPLEMMLIKNYPWIAKQVKNTLKNHASDNNNYHTISLKQIVENQEKILGGESITEKDPIDLCDPNALKVLKNNPEKFSENWELYLKYIYSHHENRSVHRFVISARWYQDLPIKIAGKCLDDLKNKNGLGLIVLALLFEGPVLEKLVTPFLPTSATINFEQKEANDDYSLEKAIVRSFNIVNPPVSLDFIAEYCKSDHIHTIAHCLFNVARRTSVAQVRSFARKLTDRPISVKKHGIRLFFLVTSVQQIHEFLVNLWRTETHSTIRTLVFEFARKVFGKNPNDETWGLFNECVDGLKPGDKDILEQVTKLEVIPKEYISKYVRLLIKVFRRLGSEGMDVWSHIKKLLEVNGHIATLYGEEIHQEIIDNFILDLSLPKNILTAGFDYLVNTYIGHAGEKLEERLVRFREIFVKIITENWNTSHPNDSNSYPVNYFIHNAIYDVTLNFSPDPVKARLINVLLDAFNVVLKPQQDPESYLRLIFSSLIQDPISSQELALKVIALLPKLVEIFSIILMSLIASCLFHQLTSCTFSSLPQYQLDLIQSLIDFDNNESAIYAAQLLYLIDPQSEKKRFFEIITGLQQHPHPAVMSIAHLILHKHS